MRAHGFHGNPTDSKGFHRFHKFATSHQYVESKGIHWIPLDSMDVHRLPNSYCYKNVCGIHGIHRNPMESYGFHGLFLITIWSPSHAWIPWNSMEFQSPFGFQADVCGTVKYWAIQRLLAAGWTRGCVESPHGCYIVDLYCRLISPLPRAVLHLSVHARTRICGYGTRGSMDMCDPDLYSYP